MKSGPRTFIGMDFSEDRIDWERLHKECWDLTEAKDDWEKQDFRKRIEKRGIDPDEFRWHLTLTGKSPTICHERAVQKFPTRPRIALIDFP